MKIFREISRLPEFDKDMRRLLKRFKTFEDDLKIFIKNELNLYHKIGIDNNGVFQVPGLKIESPKIYKAKKFACRSLKGRGVQSGIRVIYTYFEEQDKIEFIELYYKGDKENEDKDGILKYYAC